MYEWKDILGGLGILTVAVWCFCWLRAWWHSLQYIDIPTKNHLEGKQFSELPPLSVLIPACNEAASIEATAINLLKQTYSDLQLIFINDRSTDGTGEIIDRLADENSLITAIHIESLPDGWLGKVHALHVAAQQATGEWLLFTDADVGFESNALVEIVEFAQSNQVDHLAGLPRIKPAGTWLETAIAAFYTGSMFLISAKRVANPNDPLAVGVGAMNLVRRTAFEQTDGFEWLKMETIDDVGVGLMVKRSGGRGMVARAGDQISLEWYQSLGEMARGLEKNSPGLTKYNWFRAVGLLSILPLVFGGFLCLFFLSPVVSAFAWTICLLFPLMIMSTLSRQTALARSSFLLLPVGLAVLWVIIARALFLLYRRGGVQWRGTQYNIRQLREGQRLDL